MTFKLSPVSVNVRPAAPVFLTFLASKPGPVWKLTIQQNLHCSIHEDSGDVEDVLLGDAGEGEEGLEDESGESVPDAATEKPGEMVRKLEMRNLWHIFKTVTLDCKLVQEKKSNSSCHNLYQLFQLERSNWQKHMLGPHCVSAGHKVL